MYSKAQIAAASKKKFEVPSWAGLAPAGTHLNVMKGEKLVEKLIIDEKKCYFFGRNSDSCDFMTEHASCSRQHAALMYHKYLNRMFVIDLGSMHGSFIRNLRLDAHKPTPVPFDTTFHFGASTRHYILKERPPLPGPSEAGKADDENLIDLPKEQEELDNLTEYHTALNKRVTSLPIQEPKFPKRKRKSVIFAEREEVINPEDIDSSVGRFRNMISVEVIPNKRMRGGTGLVSATTPVKKHVQEFYSKGLYEDVEKGDEGKSKDDGSKRSNSLFIPNLAPEISDEPITFDTNVVIDRTPAIIDASQVDNDNDEAGGDLLKPKKKYIKEAWPGKRPGPSLLV